MTTLAIETATVTVGAALADESGVLAAFELRAGRRHAELLPTVVMSVLEGAGLNFGDLDSIAVDAGPGLFTGIRVGVAAAKGFAVALGVPVVALTSLEVLAVACEAAGNDCAIGVVDLRRGEVAWAMPPEPGESGGPAGPRAPRHGSPELLAAELTELTERIGGERIVLAGDGALRYAEMLTAGHKGRVSVAGRGFAAPPVASLAVRGVTELAAGRAVDPMDVRPVYLRDADVRINWTTRHDSPGRSGDLPGRSGAEA
jgi:tRNA threonylcarbamoyladenosine biosynthesis protein TsaB